MHTYNFDIYGMRCGACAARVQLRLSQLDGIEKVEVTHRPGHATVWVGAADVTSKNILAAIIRFGYLAKLDTSKRTVQNAA